LLQLTFVNVSKRFATLFQLSLAFNLANIVPRQIQFSKVQNCFFEKLTALILTLT